MHVEILHWAEYRPSSYYGVFTGCRGTDVIPHTIEGGRPRMGEGHRPPTFSPCGDARTQYVQHSCAVPAEPQPMSRSRR